MLVRHRWSATALTVCLLATTVACSDSDEPEAPGSSPTTSARGGSGDATPAPGSEGASRNPDTPGAGVELPQAPPTGSVLPGLEEVGRPIASRPWPTEAAAAGRLVDGFPEALRPVGSSRVVTSSVTPSEERLQVALEARTRKKPAAVLRSYRTRMARLGIKERKVRALGGAEAAGFRRGGTTITVTATRNGGRTTYTVFGVVADAGE